MTTKKLLEKYNDAFKSVMDEKLVWRLRVSAAIRAMTLAEVMQDNERLLNAAEAADHLFASKTAN